MALLLLALALGLLGAGCLDGTETTATADTVVGTLPATTTDTSDLPALKLTGDATAGKTVFMSAGCVGCHTLADAGAKGTVGPNLDEAKPDDGARRHARHQGHGRDAAVRRAADRSADRGRRCVRDAGHRRLILPPSFPRDVQAFACDFDRTLVGRDALLHPRTRAAITRSQAAGIPVIVATGRMWRSVRPYLEEAGISDLAVCYQGAAVIDPRERRASFSTSRSRSRRPARRSRCWRRSGTRPTATSTTASTSSEHTEYSRMYAGFQHIPVEEVGDLTVWLEQPPTKLVAVADPAEIPALREAMVERSATASSSRPRSPTSSRSGIPAVSKGTGIAFVARELGISLDRIVSFGDGENDIELIEEAGFGIAVEDANPLLLERADWVCPSADAEGVATVIDAYLESLA